MPGWWGLWLVLVLVIEGCGGARLGQGGAHWLRVRTAHFTLHTDLQEAEARARAELLERYLFAYQEHGWQQQGELPLRLNVVMFASPRELQLFTRPEGEGYYTTALFEPWAVLPARGQAALLVLRHELTHFLAFGAMQYQPLWFAEGIASYFETARFAPDGSFLIGEVPVHRYALLTRGARIPAERLLNETTASPNAAFYASAWLLVHYLMSERGDEFVRYQVGLAKGMGHRAAWQDAFPGLTTDKLDEALTDYARGGELAYFAQTVSRRTVPVLVERLSQADEYALRALLYGSCESCGPEAKRLAEESVRHALALQPRQLEASVMNMMSSRSPRSSRLEEARALATEHPQSWLAWLALAVTAYDQHTLTVALEAVQRALALAPRQPHAWMLAAWVHLSTGLHQDALRESASAVRLQPTNLSILQQRAALLAQLSECGALRETVSALQAVGQQTLSESERARLQQLAADCHASAATPHSLSNRGAY